jgi:hypothetical protein
MRVFINYGMYADSVTIHCLADRRGLQVLNEQHLGMFRMTQEIGGFKPDR